MSVYLTQERVREREELGREREKERARERERERESKHLSQEERARATERGARQSKCVSIMYIPIQRIEPSTMFVDEVTGGSQLDRFWWAFIVKQDRRIIQINSGVCRITTSSLTMEVEAVTHELLWLTPQATQRSFMPKANTSGERKR